MSFGKVANSGYIKGNFIILEIKFGGKKFYHRSLTLLWIFSILEKRFLKH